MERSFRHPRGMYLGREAGPWFPGPDIQQENSWEGSPFSRWSQDYHGPRRGQGPPNPQWGHSNPQWDHLNPRWGQDHQNSQCYPAPRRAQYHSERPSRYYGCGFDNGNFLQRGSGSYRRRSRGRFRGKCSSSSYKGKDSSHSSSRVLVEMKQSKKENDSEMKKDESAIPKETKQAQEDSVASVKNTDPPQVSQKASKAIISPSQFSFHLPPDSLTCSLCSPAKTEDTELTKLGTGSKAEDSHQGACCTQAATSELPATLKSLELEKEDEKIELATEIHRSLVASLASAEAPTEKQAPSETMKDSHPVVKQEPDTEAHSYQAAPVASDEAPIEKQAPSKVTESVHPMVKEEPALVPEIKQNMNIAGLIDPSSVTELSAPSCVVEPPAPLETREALLSLGSEEDELLESSQPIDHFNHIDSPPAVEIPFLDDATDECQSEGKEDLELIQMGGSHEDTDCCQAGDALAVGSSVLPVISRDVHSVPVLVSGKETEQPYFWESESSLHAQKINWSDGGKGWAPEDYQEPSWGVDKAKKCGDVSEPEINLVLSRTSFHSHCSSDQNPDTGRVLECRSSSSKSHHNSDLKHSSAQRTIKCLRSPLRQDHHSRSPLRRRQHLRSPMRRDRSHSWDSSKSSGGREITRTDYCCKCHCKCCQNPSQESFQERELPHSYSAHKMHRYHPSKETSKSYRTSHSYSPENSTMKSQTRKKKTHHEETKKGKSTSVKQTKSTKKSQTRKKKPTHHEETKKGRSTSVKQRKSSKVQLVPSSEDTGFPHEPCAGKETGTPAPSKIVEDPRSVAVLTRKNQIEQDYLQVVLNFAVVATMLLQKEPCMEQTLEVALRANMRSVGDYYESMLKNFIENYDLSETR